MGMGLDIGHAVVTLAKKKDDVSFVSQRSARRNVRLKTVGFFERKRQV